MFKNIFIMIMKGMDAVEAVGDAIFEALDNGFDASIDSVAESGLYDPRGSSKTGGELFYDYGRLMYTND